MSKPIRVLILEDRESDAELMAAELRSAGFEPNWTRVETEKDFLDRIEDHPDVILADYHLPQFDGIAALHHVQQRGLDIPFVIVSGDISENIAVNALKQGANDYLIKDRLARLGQAVSHALDQKRLRLEKQKADEERLKAAVKYRLIFEQAIEGIFQSTPSGQYLTANPALAHMLGFSSPDELLRSITNIERQLYVRPEQRAEFRRMLDRHGEIKNYEMQFYRKDGSTIWISANVRAVYSPDGSVLYYEGSNVDITQRKHLEEAKLQGERMAAIGTMASKMAHEIRNPLTAITLNIEIITEKLDQLRAKSPELESEFRGKLNLIASETTRIQRITQYYLQLGRLPKPQKKLTNLNELLAKLIDFLRSDFNKHNIHVNTDLDPAVTLLSLDPTQFWQAFLNLFRNSEEAMPDGGTLAISTKRTPSEIVITVADTGEGMTEEQRKNLFRPFYTTKSQGTGLGLALTHQIVTEHAGQIECESVRGQGTTFRMHVPLVE